MRTVRIMQFIFLVILMVLDTIVMSIFNRLGLDSIQFVSSFAFVGLLLFQQTDSNTELGLKIGMVTLWLELNHVGSYPVFLATYLITFLLMGIIKTLIGSDIQEFYVLVILAITIKEILSYIFLITLQAQIISPLTFISQRAFWVIFGSLLVIPVVVSLNKRMHRYILQRTQNMYMS